MKDKTYIQKLENIIKQMLVPLKNIPLNLVIEGISGYKVLPFNIQDKMDQLLLKNLKKVALIAGREINQRGIDRLRSNEAGNDIEKFVKSALTRVGYTATTPLTSQGKKKATGYPDIEFIDGFGRTNYLECKTFNLKNISTTQRSFYFSPSKSFKVTKNAHHFILSYEIVTEDRKAKLNAYKCKSWKILTLDKLSVDVKYEFNSDNARLYTGTLILAEGEIK